MKTFLFFVALLVTSAFARATRVLIVGGGPSGLATAFHLTNQQSTPFEVEVATVGWRLGGKCHTGRNDTSGFGMRIEEHGLHAMFGWYDNTFDMLRQVYHEAPWPSTTYPLTNLSMAMRENRVFFDLAESLNGTWVRYGIPAPDWSFINNPLTGQTTIVTPCGESTAPTHPSHFAALVPTLLGHYLQHLSAANTSLCLSPPQGVSFEAHVTDWLSKAKVDSRNTPWLHLAEEVSEFFLAVFRGLTRERPNRFIDLDPFDLREWLLKNGLPKQFEWNVMLKEIYSAGFACPNGVCTNATYSAGVGLFVFFRTSFFHAGKMGYPMTAGTADVLMSPLYRLLKKRGVKFSFFHNATRFLSSDGVSIDQVHFEVQANVTASEYSPLIRVQGLDTWPSHPLYDQLASKPNLRSFDLESPWSNAPVAMNKAMHRGRDFDIVVSAIPVQALRHVVQDLKQPSAWPPMFEHVVATPTFGVQLWFTETAKSLGVKEHRGSDGKDALIGMGNYGELLSVLSDYSQLMWAEDWAVQNASVHPAKSVLYVCNGYQPTVSGPVSFSNSSFPALERGHLQRIFAKEMISLLPWVYPKLFNSSTGQLDYSLLAGPSFLQKMERLLNQYYTVNVAPSELYTLTLPGGAQHRVAPSDTGFDNLYFAGDWTDNHILMGSFEGSVTSAVLVSQALSGQPMLLGPKID